MAWWRPLACGAGGVALGAAGTLVHAATWTIGPWQDAPLGIVLAGAAVAALALTARAWAGYWGMVAVALGAFAVTQAMSAVGPGGDVLIPARPVGYAWLILAGALPVAVAFAPRRWVADGGEGPAANVPGEGEADDRGDRPASSMGEAELPDPPGQREP
jgi:hypothetical protein